MHLSTNPFSASAGRSHPFLITFGTATCLLSLVACGNATDSAANADDDCQPVAEVDTITDGELNVLVTEYPPFVSMEGGELTGIEGEYLHDVADSLCLELNASTNSFAGVIEGLQAGRADISAGSWTVNEEREELFEVSDPIFTGGMGIVTQGEDWKTIEDLQGLQLGTPQGYIWVDQLIEVFGQENVSEYQNDQAVLNDVAAGRIDVGLVSFTSNGWRLEQDQFSELSMVEIEPTPELPYTQNPPLIVALIEKGNTELRDVTNTVIEEHISSGAMAEQFEQHGIDPGLIVSDN